MISIIIFLLQLHNIYREPQKEALSIFDYGREVK
jgi:hypothetical protein